MCAVILCLLLCGAEPTTFTGTVTRTIDGDTVEVLVGTDPVRVRLEGIDAPERGQPFGTQAKGRLSELVHGKTVTVRSIGKDRYGRTLGTIYVGEVNANLEMVRDGMAWHYKRYSDDAELSAVETAARSAKAGLWRDAEPLAPWDWRRGKRK